MPYTRQNIFNTRTGQINWTILKCLARERLIEIGNPEPSRRAVKSAIYWYRDGAVALRGQWRRNHGLPDGIRMVEVSDAYMRSVETDGRLRA